MGEPVNMFSSHSQRATETTLTRYKYTTLHSYPLIKMASTGPHLLLILTFYLLSLSSSSTPTLFREYIGAEFNGVKLSDVPINPSITDFHFILSFAIDYTTSSSNPTPTNGHFNVFWDSGNLTPSSVSSLKSQHPNVKLALSLGGDTVGPTNAYFNPASVSSWVDNAVSSLTDIINRYHLDGIDIDYEHFKADPETFAECVGQLITRLKRSGVISFASIAPFDDDVVQAHYVALWKKYGGVIDYVNFQFYAYDSGTSVSQFLGYFEMQSKRYKGGKVLVSFGTDPSSGGLRPAGGFFRACRSLKVRGKLHGIFVWSADDSMSGGFRYEKQSQAMLASGR